MVSVTLGTGTIPFGLLSVLSGGNATSETSVALRVLRKLFFVIFQCKHHPVRNFVFVFVCECALKKDWRAAISGDLIVAY